MYIVRRNNKRNKEIMPRQIIDKVSVENEKKKTNLFLEIGLINGVENTAETNYHKKHTTYLEIFISKKDIKFQVLKKNLVGKSTNR